VDEGPDTSQRDEPAYPGHPGGSHGDVGHETERRDAFRDRWSPRLALSLAIGLGAGLLLAQVATAVYQQLRGLLLVVVVSLFLSFALEPAVQWQSRRGIRRGYGTGLVFLLSLVLVGGFMAAMAGLVIDQVRTLIGSAPSILEGLAEQAARLPGEAGESVSTWLEEQTDLLPSRVAGAAAPLGRGALDVGQTLLGVVFQAATIALVTFYLVADGPKIRFTLARRLPLAQQLRVLGVWELAIAKTGGYVYSRVLTAVVSAIFHIAVFTLLGLQYAVALGVWVGLISSLIPAVGTYLAGALPTVVALATDPTLAIWVLVAIVAYQQVENYLIVPRITAHTVELHPAVAFLSVLGGAALAGAPGALLAIPAVAIVTSLLSAWAAEHDVLHHELLVVGQPQVVEMLDEYDHLEEEHRQAQEREVRLLRARREQARADAAEPRPDAQDPVT
jgi:predicted PurR-regulated permease PerM